MNDDPTWATALENLATAIFTDATPDKLQHLAEAEDRAWRKEHPDT